MIVRLNHPWKYHHTLDVLDSDGPHLTLDEARALTRTGYATDVDELITPTGGGWVVVALQAGPKKVRGTAAALRALRRAAGQ